MFSFLFFASTVYNYYIVDLYTSMYFELYLYFLLLIKPKLDQTLVSGMISLPLLSLCPLPLQTLF